MEQLLACKKSNEPTFDDLLSCKKQGEEDEGAFGGNDLNDLLQNMRVSEKFVKKVGDDKTFNLKEELKYLDLYREYVEDPLKVDADNMPTITPNPLQTMTKYMSTLSELMKTQTKFVDPEFPPEQKSLEGNGSTYSKDWISGKRPITLWNRPNKFYGEGKFKLFFDKVEPHDIKQGTF